MEPTSHHKKLRQGMLGFKCRKGVSSSTGDTPAGKGKVEVARSIKDVAAVVRRELQQMAKKKTETCNNPGGNKVQAKKKKKIMMMSGCMVELPERWKLLEEMYEEMEGAVSLIRMRRQVCLFSAICKAVESSMQRRFERKQLQEMQQLFPEAIQVDEHQRWDPETLRNTKDLRITLLPYNTNSSASQAQQMVARRLEFRRRLEQQALSSSSSHHLPPLFRPHFSHNHTDRARARPTNSSSSLPSTPCICVQQMSSTSPKPHTPVQTPPSAFDLSTRFLSPPHSSSNTPASTPYLVPSLPTPQNSSKPSQQKVAIQHQAVIKSLRFATPVKRTARESLLQDPPNEDMERSTVAAAEPILLSGHNKVFSSPITTAGISSSFATPKKAARNVSRLLPFHTTVSPPNPGEGQEERCRPFSNELCTPKRPRLSERGTTEEATTTNSDVLECEKAVIEGRDDNNQEWVLPDCESKKTKYVDLTSWDVSERLSASDKEIVKLLPKELVASVQARERKSLEETESGLENARRRQQMIAALPQLFNMLRLIFQSCNRTVLTYKNLTKMVLSSHPEITDRGEIREQLQLLVDLAPDWISAKPSTTGELLYRINRTADTKAVFGNLARAV